ncbi:hypothetical protein QBC37DRAFT_309090 [Rhypophila decipiens]|uniref:Uncharacterized protein n=1 Tax=Rhypophila decipiens TaxID=261697 RepID=A0AAN7BAW6_9PEZI|nr:hypothetical protein QBC37DRAFT_309090 [Rhypophila decipiens]
MGNYMSVEHAKSAHGSVDTAALSENLSSKKQRLLRWGLVREKDWTQLPTEGIYQIAISEVLETGSAHPLVHGGSRAFAVTAVLDLGLRMLESPRGRQALQNLALRTFKCTCPESENTFPSSQHSHICPDSQKCSGLPLAISTFLRSVRYRFPAVILDKRDGFQDKAFSIKQHGSHNDEDFWCSHIPTLEKLKFNPKEEAVLHLSWELVDKLYWTRLKADTWSIYSLSSQDKEKGEQPKMVRFKGLQFHLATMVAHHLCHLFMDLLMKGDDNPLADKVDEVRVLRLAQRYDAGEEFENEFFGGRPRLFIDGTFNDASKGPEERYAGQSYLVKRGEDSRRIGAVIPLDRIEEYLRGDFSSPLLSAGYSEKDDSRFELYRDIKRRYRGPGIAREHNKGHKNDNKRISEAELEATADIVENGSFDHLPWDVKIDEYKMLKKACYNPSVRLVDTLGY